MNRKTFDQAFNRLMMVLLQDQTTATLDRLGQLVASKPPLGLDMMSDPVAREFFARGLMNLGSRVLTRASALHWQNGLKPKQLAQKVERLARAGQLHERTIGWVLLSPVVSPPWPYSASE